MILHPSLAKGTITCYCGSLVGTTEGGRGNMLDLVVHYPYDCYDIGPPGPTPTGMRASGSQCLTPSREDMEKHVRFLATKFMDTATGNTFLLKHLLADLHVVRRKQHTLLAQIKHGLVQPSQAELHFQPNSDGSNMSLKDRNDFLER